MFTFYSNIPSGEQEPVWVKQTTFKPHFQKKKYFINLILSELFSIHIFSPLCCSIIIVTALGPEGKMTNKITISW